VFQVLNIPLQHYLVMNNAANYRGQSGANQGCTPYFNF